MLYIYIYIYIYIVLICNMPAWSSPFNWWQHLVDLRTAMLLALRIQRVLKVRLEKKYNKCKRRMWAQEIHTGLESH